MLSGDETGWLLGDYILSQIDPDDRATSVVASTVVSSRMLVRDRRALGCTTRRDPDRFQVAGPRRRRPAGQHTGLRLRGSHRALRRPGGGPGQGRHQRRGADLRSGRDAQAITAARCSTRSTTSPAASGSTSAPPYRARCADADEAAAADAPTAGVAADAACRIRLDHNGSLAERSESHGCADLHRRRRRYVGPGRGPTVGHRTEGQVLHRGPVPGRRGSGRARHHAAALRDELAAAVRAW